MILVTVGNARQPFRRLLAAVDALARDGVFGRELVKMQTGYDQTFRAVHCDARPFWAIEEFQQALSEASLIITHGGCTVLEVIQRGKLPVVMPRLRGHGEHINDHQLYFTQTLAARGRIVPAYEERELSAAVAAARARGATQSTPMPPSRIRELVQNSLTELFGRETV